MPIDVQAFRAAAEQGGYITLQDQPQGEVLVKGGSGTWLKSALDIGNARQDNILTLAALRDAMQNDPAFAFARNEARALCESMEASRPLKAEDVTRILDDMAALSARKVKETAYTLAMRSLNPLTVTARIQTVCQQLNLPADIVPEKLRSAFIQAMGNAVAELVGDGADPSVLEGLGQMLSEKTGQLVRMCRDVQQSEVREKTRLILMGQIFEKGAMKSPEALRDLITLRENLEANNVLIGPACDVSSPDAGLAKAISTALQAEGISDVPSQRCLETLGKALREQLEKAAQPNPAGPAARLTQERVEAIRADVIRQFTEAVKEAKGLQTPSDAAFMTKFVLDQSFPMSAETVRLLVAHADHFSAGEVLSCIGKNSAGILQELSQIGEKFQSLFGAFPKKHCPEALQGRQFFMTATCGLALGRAGLAQEQLEKAERFLGSPSIRALRQGLVADYAGVRSISNLSLLDTLHGTLCSMLGISSEEYAERAVLPRTSLSEAPVDVRLAIDPKSNVFKGAELFPEAGSAELQAKRKLERTQTTLAELQTGIALEMRRLIHPAPSEVTQIGKDLERDEDVYVDGVRISTDSSALPEGVDARFGLVNGALEAFAKMLFGRGMAELSENEKWQAMSLAGVSSQIAVNSLLSSVVQSLLPEGSYSVASGTQRNISLTALPSGDVAVRVEVRQQPKMLGTMDGSVTLDVRKSSVEGVLTFTVPAGGPKQVADSYASWMAAGGDIGQIPPGMKMPITDLRFDGAINAVPLE